MPPQKGQVYQHKKNKKRIEVLSVGEYQVLYQVLLTRKGEEPKVASFNGCTVSQFERDYVLAENQNRDYA